VTNSSSGCEHQVHFEKADGDMECTWYVPGKTRDSQKGDETNKD